ncbi:hypothetical protein [Niabella beijingensis]|uniref:hypothetical protein n=1 Tax=Niabella beijingensis TaxID=2872700 RepID=UPI001CC02833|nr:hypothetical protein [Niabella beijingensis]MBZ4192265.1 hypothetical protein [Niabella beijingensis]
MKRFFVFVLLSFVINACSNKKEVLQVEDISGYLPVNVGKYMVYRIDSTVFPRSGTVTEVHKYRVKHTITQEIADNAGRKTYVVERLINNEAGTGTWVGNGTYFITPGERSVDVIDNNMRVTVLQGPLRTGFSWKGNSKLPLNPYDDLYQFNIAGQAMNAWNFSYTAFGDMSYQGQTYKDVWTVLQQDETLGLPPTSTTILGYKEFSTEKYAKGIGLVFKDFQLYQYEDGSNVDFPEAHYTGFGITMWMIDHN